MEVWPRAGQNIVIKYKRTRQGLFSIVAVKCGNKSDHANELMRFRYIQSYVDEGVDVLTLSY